MMQGDLDMILEKSIQDHTLKSFPQCERFLQSQIETTIDMKAEIGDCKSYLFHNNSFTVNEGEVYYYLNLIDKYGRTIPAKFIDDTNCSIKTGDKIQLFGTFKYDMTKQGIFINIGSLKIVGVGEIWQKYLDTKKSFNEAGMFTKHTPLPTNCNRIALITPKGSAGEGDFKTILATTKGLFEDWKLIDWHYKITEYYATMWGQKTIASVNERIRDADNGKHDVIVIVRGGGSLESLWQFNSELIGDVIYKAKTPIISAIGHEKDISLCDMVADIRASTPSHAAMLIIQHIMKVAKENKNK